MQQSQHQKNIFTCENCGGAGIKAGKKCCACQGYGVVLFLHNKVFFWKRKFSRLGISQERYEKKLRILINFSFFIFGIAGILCLAMIIFDWQSGEFLLLEAAVYKNDYTLVFWLSILTDMYLVYRISRESRIKHLVERKLFFKNITISENIFDWSAIRKYKKNDIFKCMSRECATVIENGWILANKLHHRYVLNIHLFINLLYDNHVNLLFSRLGVDYKKMSGQIKRALNEIVDHGKTELSIDLVEIFLSAYDEAFQQGKNKVDSVDIMRALAAKSGIVKEILFDLGLEEADISHVAEWVNFHHKLVAEARHFKLLASYKPGNTMDRAYTAVATPNLNSISEDMTLSARAGAYDLCVDKSDEVAEIFRILEVENSGCLLVGETGVGKRTLVEKIAQLLVEEDVPRVFKDKRLVSMSVAALVAGATHIGELEKRVMIVLDEVRRSKNIILFIEDIHYLVGAGSDGGQMMDGSAVLAEAIAARNYFVIGATTPVLYKEYLEKSSLGKKMVKLLINEPKADQTISILEAKALLIESRHKIYFSYQSLTVIVKLASRYLHEEFLPEKAIKILEETALAVKAMRGERAIVSVEDVSSIIAERTNIPLNKIMQNEKRILLNLEQKIHERVIGQDEAVKSVAAAMRRARTDMREKNRPIASFLFLGPTGVGKTEVARTLARVYFGAEENMIRIDMSEYQGDDALAKLIGREGESKGGYLTEAVLKSPFALILLDEIEKASFDILNVFLQVLDDGRLTDAAGKTVDFTNTIIIATSNVGTEFIANKLKENISMENIRQLLINDYLKTVFRPEFLNRFDGINIFHPLNMRQVIEIARLFLNGLKERLAEKGIFFSADEMAVSKLAEMGYDKTMGARPLRRVIQDKVEDELAKLFLEEKLQRRDKIELNADLSLNIIKAVKL